MPKYGTRHEVFDLGTAQMTRGGLRKEDLIISRSGKIVSKKKSEQAKKNFEEFGFKKRVRETPTEPEEPKKKRTRRQRKRKDVEL